MGDVGELRKAFDGFHPQVRHVLAACPSVHKWALFDRNPQAHWSEGNVTLLGDACHPMTPYMAQGAAMAIEDAAVLSRCLEGVDRDGVEAAFRRFEATRKPRTSRVQLSSRTNTWLKTLDRSGLGLWLRRLERAAGDARSGVILMILGGIGLQDCDDGLTGRSRAERAADVSGRAAAFYRHRHGMFDGAGGLFKSRSTGTLAVPGQQQCRR